MWQTQILRDIFGGIPFWWYEADNTQIYLWAQLYLSSDVCSNYNSCNCCSLDKHVCLIIRLLLFGFASDSDLVFVKLKKYQQIVIRQCSELLTSFSESLNISQSSIQQELKYFLISLTHNTFQCRIGHTFHQFFFSSSIFIMAFDTPFMFWIFSLIWNKDTLSEVKVSLVFSNQKWEQTQWKNLHLLVFSEKLPVLRLNPLCLRLIFNTQI